jgi:hypothetical protein
VRVELPSHRETVEFAERLEAEGVPVLRRWTLPARRLADRGRGARAGRAIRTAAPEGSRVEAEVSGAAVWKVADPYPFAVFGGLGG